MRISPSRIDSFLRCELRAVLQDLGAQDGQQLSASLGTLVHEYQHLINAARRIYINNANDFEEVWLNEGLSHTAEELLYYRASGLTPRQNIDATSIRSSQQRVDAANAYQIDNLDRYAIFLGNPAANSPYADNDSLATRGATWGFLRYAADHQGTSDGTVWRQLVNSTTSGLANLTNVFGGTILNEFRDWSISVYTDDLTATTTTYPPALASQARRVASAASRGSTSSEA